MPDPWPVAIYLETSILRGLPVEIATADFLQLKRFCADWDISILTPRLCVAELVQARKQQVSELIRRAGGAVTAVSKYLDAPPALIWGQTNDAILRAVEATVRRYIEAQGIIVISTPEIPLQVLLDMAVQKIRPFEEKREKGSRDTIILFSVIEHAKTLSVGDHLLITDDGIFGHEDVIALAGRNGVDLRIVDSISVAIQHLAQFLDAAAKEVRARRSGELVAFLNQHRPEIENHIRAKGEFTATFLLDSISPLGETLVGIEKIEVRDVGRAQPGYLPIGIAEGQVEISFDAKVRFTVALRQRSFMPTPKYRVGETEISSVSDIPAPFSEDEPVTKREIEKDVRVEGSARLRRDSDQYSDLELGRVAGSSILDAIVRRMLQ